VRAERHSCITGMQSVRRILTVLILTALSQITYSQDPNQKVNRQTATEAYSREDFSTALIQFSELSQLFPRDPMYKYYRGVCMVKLERDPEEASELLMEAIKGSAAIRTVPSDGFFFLGRAQQMSGRFQDAIQSFNNFSTLVSRKESREMNVDNFIAQCRNGQGRIAVGDHLDNNSDKREGGVPLFTKPVDNITAENEGKAGNIRIVPEEVSAELDEKISDALDLQYKADSAALKADSLRQIAETLLDITY